MKIKTLQALFLAGSLILASCGTQKKLEQTTMELNRAKEASAKQAEQITALESGVKQLKAENMTLSEEARDCREVKEALRKNLESINKALAEDGSSLRRIHAKVEESLLKFYNAGVDVHYKNGLVHISMEDQLVFNSGSSTVGWEGKQVLGLVAEEINKYPKVPVYVIGNTDDVSQKSGSRDNWTLSTERANAIVRILRDEFKVDPARMISGGRAQYHPISDNSTAEGKTKNRRVDIILNPMLTRTWEKSATE